MDSPDIRTRIAEMEAANPSGAAGRGQSEDEADGDALSWESLFAGFGDAAGDEFSLAGWLAEGLQGVRGALRGAGLDEEFWGHMRAAEREALLAVRHLLDVRLEALARASQPAAESSRLQEIEVDF